MIKYLTRKPRSTGKKNYPSLNLSTHFAVWVHIFYSWLWDWVLRFGYILPPQSFFLKIGPGEVTDSFGLRYLRLEA